MDCWLWIDGEVLYLEREDGFMCAVEIAEPWATSTPATYRIHHDLTEVLIAAETEPPPARPVGTDESGACVGVVLTPEQALGIARSREYRNYLMAAPDALAMIFKDSKTARYELAPYLYGIAVEVEADVETPEKSQ